MFYDRNMTARKANFLIKCITRFYLPRLSTLTGNLGTKGLEEGTGRSRGEGASFHTYVEI